MFPTGILVILTGPIDPVQAASTIQRAKEQAFRPQGLSFALPRSVPLDADVLYYDTLADLTQWETGAAFFLLLNGEHNFSARWDLRLSAEWMKLGKRQLLLTASISPVAAAAAPLSDNAPTRQIPKISGLRAVKAALPQLEERSKSAWKLPELPKPKPVFPSAPLKISPASDADVCLPSLKETLEDGQVVIGRGLPLVCAAGPVETLLIDPALLFGPLAFFQGEPVELSMLSMKAYLEGWSICALHQAIVWPAREPVRRVLMHPPADAVPGTTLARFEYLMGFRDGQWKTHAKAAMGLFGTASTYAQQMPAALGLSQQASRARKKLLETPMPLMISAFVDLPQPRYTPAFYTLRFGFLRRLEHLPLRLYTGGSQERQLRSSFPNTQSYPDNHLLPRTLLDAGMTEAQHFARSKPLLMLRAARRQPEYEHVAWVDMDILPHPICPQALPDFSHLMDDRIHLATVDGLPDASFVVVPAQYLPHIAREALSITLLDAELKRGFSEERLWQRLFLKKPEWFAVHTMPRRRLLFLTGFDPRFLSHTLRAQLKDLPKPYLGVAADSERAHRQGGRSHA